MMKSIDLGSYSVNKIDYSQVQAGDIVCTYEALSTNAKIKGIVTAQKWASITPRGELNKMFHFEIIIQAHPRKGIFEIAHVNGSLGKVVLQNDDFKAHFPGQAFIVFRAKDSLFCEEIVRVAKKTARNGNGHGGNRLPFSLLKIACQIHKLVQCFIFENCPSFNSASQLRRLAQLTVDYTDSDGLYNDDKTELLNLRCPEYISYVLSVAKISTVSQDILTNPSLSRDQRIERVYTTLCQGNLDEFPFYCSTSLLTPAYLVDALFRSRSHFDCVGYLGHIHQSMTQEQLESSGIRWNIPIQKIVQILPKDPKYQTLSHDFILGVFLALKIVSEEGEFFPEVMNLDFKASVVFACFFAKAHGLSLQEVKGSERDDFVTKFQKLGKDSRPDVSHTQIVKALHPEIQMEIGTLEKKLLQQSLLDRRTKTYHLSLNALSMSHLESSFFRKLLDPFLPSIWIERMKQSKKMQTQQLEKSILYVYQQATPNACVILTSFNYKNNRPWIHYSTDSGITWDQEPFIQNDGIWHGYFRVEKGDSFIYRLFIGPEDSNIPNPLDYLKAWQKTPDENIFIVNHASPSIIIEFRKYQLIAKCDSPEWIYSN